MTQVLKSRFPTWRRRRAPSAIAVALAIAVLAMPVYAGLYGQPGAAQPAARSFQSPVELNWELVDDTPGISWYTLKFVTPEVGYVVGGPDWNGDNNGAGQPYFAKTTDGGQTWAVNKLIASPGLPDGWMRGLDCKDANTCWSAGRGYIVRTTDGGGTWQLGRKAAEWSGWVWSVGYTGADDTVLVGTTGYSSDPNEPTRKANFLRSTNGLDFLAVVADDPREFVVYDFACPTSDLCYAAAKQTAFRTTDAGISWARQQPTNLTRFFGIDCVDENRCWEVGGSNGAVIDGGGSALYTIMYTLNGGQGWYPAVFANPSYGTRPRFYNVDMVDAQHGFAVGCSDAPDPIAEICTGTGIIYRTDDGTNWYGITSPTTADIMDVHAFSMTDVYVVDFSGKIWHGSVAPTPTPTATDTPTSTPTPTATNTPTNTPTSTPSPTPTPSTGIVSGIAFVDENGNEIWDPEEPALAGAVIGLSQGVTEVYSSTSQTDGAFRIDGVEPGAYTISEKAPPAGYQSSTNRATFFVPANTLWNFFFGHLAEPTATPTLTSSPTATEGPTSTPTATMTLTPAVSYSFMPLMLHGE